MLFLLVCQSCGFDFTFLRYKIYVEEITSAKASKELKNNCCKIHICSQISPPRNLPYKPQIDKSS